MFALVAPFSDLAPEPAEEVITLEEEAVQEDGGTTEPMCCGPNEPAPPRPK